MREDFRFHHIGMVTSSIVETKAAFAVLGVGFGDRIEDPRQSVSLAFSVGDHPLIELVEPWGGSKVERLLTSRGVGLYHTCYEVSSIADADVALRRNRWICVLAEVPAIAFGNRRVSFYLNRHGGIIEILEA